MSSFDNEDDFDDELEIITFCRWCDEEYILPDLESEFCPFCGTELIIL